jgi:hypothetical protein
LKGHELIVDGVAYPIDTITARLHVICGSGLLQKSSFTRCDADGRQRMFDRLQTTIGKKRFTMLVPSEPRPERMILRIDTAEDRRKLRDQRKKQQKKSAKRNGKQR